LLLSLCPNEALVKGEQSLVDFKDVIVPILHEILNNDVKLVSFISTSGSSSAMANAMTVGLEGL